MTESAYDFNEQTDRSAVKTRIVTKYFGTWAGIISRNEKMFYIDLFSGQGKFDDGKESTPIEVVKIISGNPDFKRKIQCYFNEGDETRCKKLKEYLSQFDDIKSFRYQPIIENNIIDATTVKKFSNWKAPSFVFLDPCGYKGLSLELISNFAKAWGTDIIIFFNYNAINRSVSYESFEPVMKDLFGEEHYQNIQNRLKGEEEREYVILDEMIKALNGVGLKYVLPFSFKFSNMNRTSHYILFATKNILGSSKMKEIMHKEGGCNDYGEGRFEYIPISNCMRRQKSLLDYFNDSHEEFKKRLQVKYSGRTLTIKELINDDTAYSRYIGKGYKDVLCEFYESGIITCDPKPQRKGTMADHIKITFKEIDHGSD